MGLNGLLIEKAPQLFLVNRFSEQTVIYCGSISLRGQFSALRPCDVIGLAPLLARVPDTIMSMFTPLLSWPITSHHSLYPTHPFASSRPSLRGTVEIQSSLAPAAQPMDTRWSADRCERGQMCPSDVRSVIHCWATGSGSPSDGLVVYFPPPHCFLCPLPIWPIRCNNCAKVIHYSM